jgi:hypothetical protein
MAHAFTMIAAGCLAPLVRGPEVCFYGAAETEGKKMARKASKKQESPMPDQEQTDNEPHQEPKTVPPGISPETLGRAIWRETVLKAKGEKLDDAARDALWKADRKQYNGIGRRIVGRLSRKAVSRSPKPASE